MKLRNAYNDYLFRFAGQTRLYSFNKHMRLGSRLEENRYYSLCKRDKFRKPWAKGKKK